MTHTGNMLPHESFHEIHLTNCESVASHRLGPVWWFFPTEPHPQGSFQHTASPTLKLMVLDVSISIAGGKRFKKKKKRAEALVHCVLGEFPEAAIRV